MHSEAQKEANSQTLQRHTQPSEEKPRMPLALIDSKRNSINQIPRQEPKQPVKKKSGPQDQAHPSSQTLCDANKTKGSQDELLVTFFDKSFAPTQQERSSSKREPEMLSGAEDPHLVADYSPIQSNKGLDSKSQQAVEVAFSLKAPARGSLYVSGATSMQEHNEEKPRFQNKQGLIPSTHKSHTNLQSHHQTSCFSINFDERQSQKLNSSLILPSASSQQRVDLQHLHPQGLYIGGKLRKHKEQKSQSQITLARSIGDKEDSDDLQRQSSLNDQNTSSMLVQECDLGDNYNGGGELHSISRLKDPATNDSDRLSNSSSFRQQQQQSFGHFQGQAQSNQSFDQSPMTKTYTISNKIKYKSKVNMKQFLLAKNMSKNEADRASQRSIIESTNAYIRAQQENRQMYLQSAGTLGGQYPGDLGLQETAANGKQDFLGSSSTQQRQQLRQLPQPQLNLEQVLRLQQTATSQMKRVNQQPLPAKQVSSVGNASQSELSKYDPEQSLFQLQQEVHRVEYAGRSRQAEKEMAPLPQVLVGGKVMQTEVVQQHLNGSYHTIFSYQDGSNTSLVQANLAEATQNHHMFSADKGRLDLSSKKSLMSTKHDQQLNLQQNLSTISNNDEVKMRPYKPVSTSKPDNANANQNPFQKGPKLHLFKKSRRLKTSSATRQSNEDSESQTEQTITSGVGGHTVQKPHLKNRSGVTGPETNNSTINSQSNVYGTIDQKSTDKISTAGKSHLHGSAPAESKNQSTTAVLSQLIINQPSEEEPPMENNPYLAQLRAAGDDKTRPHTTELVQANNSIADVYHDEESLKRQSCGDSQNSQKRGFAVDAMQKSAMIRQSLEQNSNSSNRKKPELLQTAHFNTSDAQMNGSRHSFYCNQQVPRKQSSRQGKKTLSKGSKGAQVPPSGKQKTNSNLSAKQNASSVIQAKQRPLGNRNASKTSNMTFNTVASAKPSSSKPPSGHSGTPEEQVRALSHQLNKKLLQNSAKNLKGDTYMSRSKRSDQEASQEQITHNDSAQTPCFLNTPQRTDSNWGGSVYQNMINSRSRQVNEPDLPFFQSTDSSRGGNPPSSHHRVPQPPDINIHIAQDGSHRIPLKHQQEPKPFNERPVAQQADTADNEMDANLKRLSEAIYNQSSLDAQRMTLQTSKKAYRRPTRPENVQRLTPPMPAGNI